jgi:hypothetical protein
MYINDELHHDSFLQLPTYCAIFTQGQLQLSLAVLDLLITILTLILKVANTDRKTESLGTYS